MFTPTLHSPLPASPLTALIPTQAIFWVETKNKTLEEIDALFSASGEKHSSVPDVEAVRKGTASLDESALEKEIQVMSEEKEHVLQGSGEGPAK